MFTRKQYLNHECSHADYYGQFVTDNIKRILTRRISVDEIRASKNRSFNDIRLSRWDSLPMTSSIAAAMRECGDYPTLAGKVCVYKQAARELIQ